MLVHQHNFVRGTVRQLPFMIEASASDGRVRVATRTIFVSLAAFLLSFLGSWIQARAIADSKDAVQARQQRLEFMKRTVGEFQLSFKAEREKPLPLTESPVLRFSNPVRDSFSDGTIFLCSPASDL